MTEQLTFNFEGNGIDMTDSPEGYYPILKSSIDTTQNLCRFCDFRPLCPNGPHCMSYGRQDKKSVVFKKKQAAQ